VEVIDKVRKFQIVKVIPVLLLAVGTWCYRQVCLKQLILYINQTMP